MGNVEQWVWRLEFGQIANWGLGLWAEIDKIMEKSKTKEVVQDDLRTAMEPEKKL